MTEDSSKKKASEILTEAADLLESGQIGWRQMAFVSYDPKPCLCAWGLLAYCGDEEVKRRVEQSTATSPWIADRILKSGNIPALSKANSFALDVCLSPSYNDTIGRTREEVIARLRKAAELAVSKGQ